MTRLRPVSLLGAAVFVFAAVVPVLAIDVPIVPRGAEWRYREDGMEPGPA